MIPRVSVVLAVQDAAGNVEDFIDRVDPGRHPDLELLVCTADPVSVESGGEQLRVLRSPAGTLIPELWAAGVAAARGPLVATTTAHCLPDAGWAARLLELETLGPVAVGGIIAPDPHEAAHSRAIYLMRYLPFRPPGQAGAADEIAADNAVYRRDAVLEHADLLSRGFWEPSFHARFRATGLKLVTDPDLVVQHANRYTAMDFARQRLAHGEAFGATRVSGAPWPKRLLFALAAPLLPGIFLARLLARAAGSGVGGVFRALPYLLLYLLYWGIGEARAYWRFLIRPPPGAKPVA